MQLHFYTLETLLAALTQEIMTAHMVEQIVSEVPLTAEQVHASHILVADRDTADYLYSQILAGSDFATLAELNSTDTSTRLSGGDLGWFSPGTLTMPEVEQAAFALQPGEVSQPIESLLGYHIVRCIERGEHPLSPQGLQRQREEAVMDWLSDQREQVAIQVFITP
jgi:parvulin-like peptidyl-prolyl isomerase